MKIIYVDLDSSKTIDHHLFLIDMLNEWTSKNGSEIGITNGRLIESKDFDLLICGKGSSSTASISCSCGIKVQLSNYRENFSLSNYYKHLKSKTCILKRKKISKQINENESNNMINTHSSDSGIFQDESIVTDEEHLTFSSPMNSPVTMNQSSKRTTAQDFNDNRSKRKRI